MHVRLPGQLGTYLQSLGILGTSLPKFLLQARSCDPHHRLSPVICSAGLDQAAPICRHFLILQLLLLSLHGLPQLTTTSVLEMLVAVNGATSDPSC